MGDYASSKSMITATVTAADCQFRSEAAGFLFSATLASEQAAIGNFLSSAFPNGRQANSFRPEVLFWKYFWRHPEWSAPRSYVLKANEHILAHAGIWPVRLANSSIAICAAHVIDWAASRAKPGTGIMLLSDLAVSQDLLLTIGGSCDSRAILPRLGYQSIGELKLYAKVVRPWEQFRSTAGHDWKAPLRLARNGAWSLSGMKLADKNWRACRIAHFDWSLEPFLNFGSPSEVISQRTIAELNRFLACPAGAFSGFVILRWEQIQGYFMLSQVGRQTRIVDLRIATEDAQCWLQACLLASQTAAELPQTSEIVAGSSSRHVQAVLEEVGFRLRRTDPIFCYDPLNLLGSDVNLHLSLLDGDACFMSDPRHPYLT
jgi:hypothetical protein